MNIKKYNDITLIPMGESCFSQSVSCSLEYMDILAWALKRVYFDFIYNREAFVTFETDMIPELYLVRDNELFFSGNPNSKYKKDYLDDLYLNSMPIFEDDSMKFEGVTKDTLREKLFNFKTKFLDNDIPIILNLDTYCLRNEYIRMKAKEPQRHNSHYINIFDIDLERDYCFVVDKYFGVKNKISIEAISNSISEDNDSKIGYLEHIDNLKLTNELVLELLQKNISKAVNSENLIINGNHYYKNEVALEKFIFDFDNIIKELDNKFGKFAPQHISYPLIEYRNQKKGIGTLYRYINKTLKIDIIDELSTLFDKSYEAWYLFDLLLDKIYLKNIRLEDKKDSLIQFLYSILEIEKTIIDKANLLYEYLS